MYQSTRLGYEFRLTSASPPAIEDTAPAERFGLPLNRLLIPRAPPPVIAVRI
jgi:hypothetical protein